MTDNTPNHLKCNGEDWQPPTPEEFNALLEKHGITSTEALPT